MQKRLSHISNMIARRAQKSADEWAAAYWHGAPFCTASKADAATYKSLWEKAKAENFPEIDALEPEMGHKLDPTWMHDLALHTQIVIKSSTLCYQHGRVLYSVLRNYLATQPDPSINILETGTARGFSATVMAKALHDAKNTGRIFTLDLLPHDKPIYWNCIDDLEKPKTRRELLAPWQDLTDPHIAFLEGDSRLTMERLRMGRVHFAFLDGAHTYQDVIAEFELVAPRQKPGDITVFDDYSPNIFPGLVRAVDEGCKTFNYSTHVIRSNGDRAYVIARKRG